MFAFGSGSASLAKTEAVACCCCLATAECLSQSLNDCICIVPGQSVAITDACLSAFCIVVTDAVVVHIDKVFASAVTDAVAITISVSVTYLCACY